jgi:hypothetical protein
MAEERDEITKMKIKQAQQNLSRPDQPKEQKRDGLPAQNQKSRQRSGITSKSQNMQYSSIIKKHNLKMTDDRLLDFRSTLKEIVELKNGDAISEGSLEKRQEEKTAFAVKKTINLDWSKLNDFRLPANRLDTNTASISRAGDSQSRAVNFSPINVQNNIQNHNEQMRMQNRNSH